MEKTTKTTKPDDKSLEKGRKIAEEARNAIGTFCIEECRAYCCRKGYLVITEEEANLITQGRRKELEEKNVLKKTDGDKYTLYLGNYETSCPSLKDFMCTVHKNEKRPQACKDFPIFLTENRIFLSPRCLAVKQDKMYKYIREMLMLGFELQHGDPFSDFEIHTVELINEKNNQK